MTIADNFFLSHLWTQLSHDEFVLDLLMTLELFEGAIQWIQQQLQVNSAWEVCTFHLHSIQSTSSTNELVLFQRSDETPHCAYRTTIRRERRVTGRFAPSSVRPIGRIQRFLLIQLKPKHVFRHGARDAVFRDTPVSIIVINTDTFV